MSQRFKVGDVVAQTILWQNYNRRWKVLRYDLGADMYLLEILFDATKTPIWSTRSGCVVVSPNRRIKTW